MQLRVASWLKALQGAPEATTGLKGQSATFLLLTTVCVSVCLCVYLFVRVYVCNYSISHRLNACTYAKIVAICPDQTSSSIAFP